MLGAVGQAPALCPLQALLPASPRLSPGLAAGKLRHGAVRSPRDPAPAQLGAPRARAGSWSWALGAGAEPRSRQVAPGARRWRLLSPEGTDRDGAGRDGEGWGGMGRSVWGWPGLYWLMPTCAGPLWSILGSAERCRSVPGCTGPRRTTRGRTWAGLTGPCWSWTGAMAPCGARDAARDASPAPRLLAVLAGTDPAALTPLGAEQGTASRPLHGAGSSGTGTLRGQGVGGACWWELLIPGCAVTPVTMLLSFRGARSPF